MNSMLEKLKGLKKTRTMSEPEQEGKLAAIGKLNESASKSMGDKLSSLKKVTVASDSEQGLEKGLTKAKELIGKLPMGDEESEDAEMIEEPKMALDESASSEELEEEIQRLLAIKAEKEQEV